VKISQLKSEHIEQIPNTRIPFKFSIQNPKKFQQKYWRAFPSIIQYSNRTIEQREKTLLFPIKK
jgi:hypothetical protein